MKISAYKSPWRQLRLWDTPLGNHGHRRTVVGSFVETLSAELLGGRRHRTQGTADYCPDLSVALPDGRTAYVECKAAGRNRETFVYEGRLNKDRAFVAAGYSLHYLVWHHRAATLTVDTAEALEELLARTMRAAYLVPFPAFDAICSGLAEEKLNSGYGRNNDGVRGTYGSGRRVKIKRLEPWRVLTFADGLTKTCWPQESLRELL